MQLHGSMDQLRMRGWISSIESHRAGTKPPGADDPAPVPYSDLLKTREKCRSNWSIATRKNFLGEGLRNDRLVDLDMLAIERRIPLRAVVH